MYVGNKFGCMGGWVYQRQQVYKNAIFISLLSLSSYLTLAE